MVCGSNVDAVSMGDAGTHRSNVDAVSMGDAGTHSNQGGPCTPEEGAQQAFRDQAVEGQEAHLRRAQAEAKGTPSALSAAFCAAHSASLHSVYFRIARLHLLPHADAICLGCRVVV